MIQIDSRIGSKQMAPLLQRLGLAVETCFLEYGDIAFTNAWERLGCDPISIGIEMKNLDDVLACIQSGRYAGHQLPGMISSYNHCWLLICGQIRPHPATGILEVNKGTNGHNYWMPAGFSRRPWLWRDLESWLMTITMKGAVRIQWVPNWEHGAQWIKMCHSWHQKDDHRSHLVMAGTKDIFSDTALLVKPSLLRRLAAQLPGVLEIRSRFVADHFKTIEAMMKATPEEWAGIEVVTKQGKGRTVRLGKVVAEKVWEALHGKISNSHLYVST